MFKKPISIVVFFLFVIVSFAQNNLSYGVKAGVLMNSAILPDIKINNSIGSVLQGDSVVKGVPHYADITYNYQFGGFATYKDGFGFSMLEVNYTTTKIYDEISFNSGIFDEINTVILDRKFSYLDVAISYNIFVSKNKNLFFTIGGSPSFLLSNTGSETPEKLDIRVFSGFGFNLSDRICISARAELGVLEVYKESYIHHIMFPVSVLIGF